MKHSLTISLLVVALTAKPGVAGPAQPFEPNSRAPFSIKTTGTGPAMILVPGLSSSGDVWRTAIEHYRSRYTCHVLTLAGFADGPPPLEA